LTDPARDVRTKGNDDDDDTHDDADDDSHDDDDDDDDDDDNNNNDNIIIIIITIPYSSLIYVGSNALGKLIPLTVSKNIRFYAVFPYYI